MYLLTPNVFVQELLSIQNMYFDGTALLIMKLTPGKMRGWRGLRGTLKQEYVGKISL